VISGAGEIEVAAILAEQAGDNKENSVLHGKPGNLLYAPGIGAKVAQDAFRLEPAIRARVAKQLFDFPHYNSSSKGSGTIP
jgi:hypothetical protein